MSSSLKTEINLPYLTADASGPKHLNITLSRAKFESLIEDFIKKTHNPVEKCIKDAGLSKDKIDEVLLVGGMTRIPKVVENVEKLFNKKSSKGINPDEAVALGAAI